jgi:hypothetical protein
MWDRTEEHSMRAEASGEDFRQKVGVTSKKGRGSQEGEMGSEV